jgi:hypothetical protein
MRFVKVAGMDNGIFKKGFKAFYTQHPLQKSAAMDPVPLPQQAANRILHAPAHQYQNKPVYRSLFSRPHSKICSGPVSFIAPFPSDERLLT